MSQQEIVLADALAASGFDARIYSNVMDKSTWAEGPWNAEPDKVQWVDRSTDLDCLIVRGPMGSLCGYVGVPPDHPDHGKSYNDLEGDLLVHGGLTFADKCMEDRPECEGVCHVPYPGRADDVWWFGFDCGHHMDVSPGLDARMNEMYSNMPKERQAQRERLQALADSGPLPRDTYRPIGYVAREVEGLAQQLVQRRLEGTA